MANNQEEVEAAKRLKLAINKGVLHDLMRQLKYNDTPTHISIELTASDLTVAVDGITSRFYPINMNDQAEMSQDAMRILMNFADAFKALEAFLGLSDDK